MDYVFESDSREKDIWRRRARRWMLVCSVALVAAVVAWWRGCLPCWGVIGGSDAWRNISGTDECFPFRVKDGKGFVYQGVNYDHPCDPVVTRADWTISLGGRTYVLFDVDPGNFEPSGFKGVFNESLWIGLLGKNGEVVRKIRLATGVKDISGIRRAFRTGAYVSATKADGSKAVIFLRFPKPWPKLRPTGDSWKDFEQRQERLLDQMWEDWPNNGSGYAADWVSLRLEEKMEKEYRRAIEALMATAQTDARRDELEAEYEMARSFALDFAGDSSDTASNVHWGHFMDRMAYRRVMEVYLRNWLEAIDNPRGWEAVRSTQGLIHDVPFVATSGVAVLTVPTSWVYRRWAENDGTDTDSLNPNIDEVMPEKWQLLLRLSPKRGARKDGIAITEYEIIAPGVQDSGYLVDQGTISIKNGK